MMIIDKKTNLKKFKRNSNFLENKYGLPTKVEFCKKCVISNQRPSSTVEFKNNLKQKK